MAAIPHMSSDRFLTKLVRILDMQGPVDYLWIVSNSESVLEDARELVPRAALKTATSCKTVDLRTILHHNIWATIGSQAAQDTSQQIFASTGDRLDVERQIRLWASSNARSIFLFHRVDKLENLGAKSALDVTSWLRSMAQTLYFDYAIRTIFTCTADAFKTMYGDYDAPMFEFGSYLAVDEDCG